MAGDARPNPLRVASARARGTRCRVAEAKDARGTYAVAALVFHAHGRGRGVQSDGPMAVHPAGESAAESSRLATRRYDDGSNYRRAPNAQGQAFLVEGRDFRT